MGMNRLFFIFILLLISCTSVMALPYIQLNGSVENNDGVFIQLLVPETTSGGSGSSNTSNVNSSEFWITDEGDLDNVADITYDMISAGDINNLGYFSYLQYIVGLVGSLSLDGNPWWLAGTDLEIEENLIVSNITANNINPETTLTYSLGTGALRWLNLFVQNINAEEIETYNLVALQNVTAEYLIGNITGSETDPSSIHKDAINNTQFYYNDRLQLNTSSLPTSSFVNWNGTDINTTKLITNNITSTDYTTGIFFENGIIIHRKVVS